MRDRNQDPIENLKLSSRIRHLLLRTGILTVSDIKIFMMRNNLMKIRQIGEKGSNEIINALDAYKEFSLPNVVNEIPKRQSLISKEGIDKLSIDLIELPRTAKNPLKRKGIKTVGDLQNASEADLLEINRIGPKLLKEIKQTLFAIYANPDKYLVQSNFLLEDEKVNDSQSKIEHIAVELAKKKVNWSDIVQDHFEVEKDNYTFIMLSRYGVNPKTLEEIAVKFGVTRERVRQIQVAAALRFLNHVRLKRGSPEILKKVVEILSSHGDDLSLEKFREKLIEMDILGEFSTSFVSERISKVNLFEALICWLTLISNPKYSLVPAILPVDINSLKNSKIVSINDVEILRNISSKERRKIKRKVYFTGGINIKDAIALLSANERIATMVLDDLKLKKLENSWYTLNSFDVKVDGGKVPLRVAGLKILSITSEVDFSIFCDGLNKHVNRFYAMLAPPNVLKHFLPLLGFEISEYDKVSTKLSVAEALSKSENSVISAIVRNDGVASFYEIAEEFFQNKLSLPAVSVTLRRSPIVEKLDDGFYKLRGVEITWQQIEIAKKRQKRFSQDDEVIYGLDGVIRMNLTISNYAYLTGVIGVNKLRELSGSSWLIVHEKQSFGKAKMDDVYLWGLGPLFKSLNVQIGERIELGFDTRDKTLSMRKV